MSLTKLGRTVNSLVIINQQPIENNFVFTFSNVNPQSKRETVLELSRKHPDSQIVNCVGVGRSELVIFFL